MPIALDPKQTFPLWLESDADKSPRPEFQFKALTIRDRRKPFELSDSFRSNEAITAEQIETQSIELFMSLCTGWSNMGSHKYSAESIKDVLTHGELWELLFAAANNSHVSHEEKKSLES